MKHRKEKPKAKLKPTVWASPAVLNDFKNAGLKHFVKVPASQENKEVFKKSLNEKLEQWKAKRS